MKVLIVDDVKENVDILDQYFTSKGFETITAFTAKEAIEKAQKYSPDVILADVMMPEMDGFQLCEKLKKEMTRFRNIPVILVTVKDDVQSKIKGLSAGADDYVTKPFDIQELGARVNTALRLKQAQDELKELNELKNQFLGMASHDIKSPVSRIEMTVQKILKEKKSLTSEQVEQLSKVKDEAQTILNLISDLLNVVKIETGKMGIEKEEISLENLINEIVKINEQSAKAKKLEIETTFDKGIPSKFLADPNRLIEVFDNLISNAIKFSKSGGKIRVHIKKAKEGVEISVSDQGIGIPKNELPKVFDRFARISSKPTAGEKSTGLGLSICKQIIGLHKGKIDVDSEIGKGTTFTIFLPS